MESLSRLREAIEDHATEGKTLNDEAYRTMMEDLRKVYQALPQAHPGATLMNNDDNERADFSIIAPASGEEILITYSAFRAMEDAILEMTGMPLGPGGKNSHRALYHALAQLSIHGNEMAMYSLPHFKEAILRMRDKCLRELDDIAEGREEGEQHLLLSRFYQRLISMKATKKALIERVETKKTDLRTIRSNVDRFERTNPILSTTPFLPMKVLFAIVDKPTDLPIVFEHSMRGPDGRSKQYDTGLKKNKVDKLHKLEITLELNDPAVPTFTFDCFTSRIKFGSNNNITRQLLWVIHYLESQLELPNPKTIKALLNDKFCYKPSLVISGITGSTKDKKRAYVGDRFSITYVGKLNGS